MIRWQRWDDPFWKAEREAAQKRMEFARVMVRAIHEQLRRLYGR